MLIEKIALAITAIMKCPVEDITPETRLEDIGVDSLKAINILFELEEEFDIEIPNELIPEMTTVGDIAVCIEGLLEQQAA